MKDYIRIAFRWWWLVVIGAGVAGGFSYYTASRQPITYESSALVSVGGYTYSNNPEYGDIRIAVELASYYTATAETLENLRGTIDTLNLDMSPARLAGLVDVANLGNVPILVITVNYHNRELAAAIANTMAEQIIKNSPTNLTLDEQKQLELNADQIDLLNTQIAALSAQYDLINSELEQLDPTGEVDKITLLRAQRSTTLDQLNSALQTVALVKADNTNIRARTNTLKIIEPAVPALRANDRRVTNQAVTGAIAGAGLAIALIVIIEYLNTSIRTSEEAVQILSLPVLGTIARYGKRRDSYAQRLITNQHHSLILEGYRTLQANLLFGLESTDLKGIYLITSPKSGEGKSLTAANLAVTMALSGLKVLLIDADLHHPKQHEIFGLDNKRGLSTLLMASHGGENGDRDVPDMVSVTALGRCTQRTEIPNLTVITSGNENKEGGSLTQVSSGVFLLSRLNEWIDVFRKSKDIDIVIFDTPPSLSSVDSSVLAATTFADVILVIAAGRTSRDDALRAKGQFVQLGREVLGVVLNKTPRSGVDHGYGYGYYDNLKTLSMRPAVPLQEGQPKLQTQTMQANDT